MPSKAESRRPLPLIEPTLVEKPPTGDRWAHGIKWDGWRVQACLRAGKATLYTRRDNDCTKRFPVIAAAMAQLKTTDVVLDGEAVAIDAEGRPDFHSVLGGGARLVYKAFDILWLDGSIDGAVSVPAERCGKVDGSALRGWFSRVAEVGSAVVS